MAKKSRVWDGTAWQELASAQTDLTAYSTTAQMNTAISAALGLTLINTVTLSGTSVIVTNCFTSTYANYLIVSNCTNSLTTQNDMLFQLRAAGVTTTSGYTNSMIYNNHGAGPLRAYFGSTSWVPAAGGNVAIGMTSTIYAPQLAQRTTMTSTFSGWAASGTQQGVNTGLLDNSTQYDSLVISNSNTISGTLSIYGYKN